MGETTAIEKQPQRAVEVQGASSAVDRVEASTQETVRDGAVGDLLQHAYSQASMLSLNPDESKSLRAPFDGIHVRRGAKGDDNLLYISHIHLSDRLNDVLGIGQWALVRRSQRAEQTQTTLGKPLVRVYFEGVLLIRGAYAGEAVGAGQYHPNNPKEDYSSALESAMSDCLTRCCKRLGIGSQVWDKGYCDDWLSQHGGNRQPDREPIRPPAEKQAPPTAPAPKAPEPWAEEMTGLLEDFSIKEGKSKEGKPWTKFGLKINGEWYGTFDAALADAAEVQKGRVLTIRWKQDGKYKTVLAVSEPPTTPAEATEQVPQQNDAQLGFALDQQAAKE